MGALNIGYANNPTLLTSVELGEKYRHECILFLQPIRNKSRIAALSACHINLKISKTNAYTTE